MSEGIIPFITLVTSELDEHINEIMILINEMTDSMQKYINSMQEAITNVGKNVNLMLTESSNNKKFISESYSTIVKKIALKISGLVNKSNETLEPDIKESIESSSRIVDQLQNRITDLQLLQVINGMGTIIDTLKGEIYTKGKRLSSVENKKKISSKKTYVQAHTIKSDTKPTYYEKGAKMKTMEEILEEKRRRKKMMQKYR